MSALNRRKLRPLTVLKRWNNLCNKMKPRLPGKSEARKYAAMCGMKSMLEVEVAANMDKRKIKWKYEDEVLKYQHEPQDYEPDFTLDNDTIIEVKGKMTQETRKKLKSIKRCNPDRVICIVFGKPNNKLSARPRSMRYWQWAEKHGFYWSDKEVKDDWVKRN